MPELDCGYLRKMQIEAQAPARYHLRMDDRVVPLETLISRHLSLTFTGQIACIFCERQIKKTFNQGYCFPCLRRLARCDQCIVRPELCHFAEGTCREPEWATNHCLQPHVVYLSYASGIKVGITRATQVPTRWLDQGAVQALPLARVSTRRDSGLLEVACKAFVSDRTDWRRMLRHHSAEADLVACRDRLQEELRSKLDQLGLDGPVQFATDPPMAFSYPLGQVPHKLKAWDLLKNPHIEGELYGMKGQYMVFDSGVINIRKHAGFKVRLEAAD